MSTTHCKYCGTSLSHKKSNASFCSTTCRGAYWRDHNEDDPHTDEQHYYPVVVNTPTEYEDEAEYEEGIEVIEPEIVRSKKHQQQDKDISDAQARTIRVNLLFIRYMVQLRNISAVPLKKKKLLKVINQFEVLKESYIEQYPKQYALYPFATELELIIAEIETFCDQHLDENSKVVEFYINDDFDEWTLYIEGNLTTYNDKMRKKYSK